MISKRMSKSIKLIALAFCVLTTLILSSAVVCADETCFTDTHEHWAESAINRWKDAGFINGYPDGSFKPDALVTRAEFSKMITLAFGLKDPVSVEQYTDLDLQDWYAEYVPYAAKYLPVYALPESNSITQPYTDNDGGYLPSAYALRPHVAEALSRIREERDGSQIEIPNIETETKFLKQVYGDGDLHLVYTLPHGGIAANHKQMIDAVWLATRLGVMNGYDDGYFRPYSAITRAEAVTVIDRVLTGESVQQTAEQ